ncbi:hypothetical protein [Flavisolibacter nicotianae]|uniref:hypothetical protein n=1 Tax=Flavisolibacter nicotianae TaxID=2364882 RepID=UPI000EAEFD8C|nr:hypothetical protein [Flavisolibacter nicotianae]
MFGIFKSSAEYIKLGKAFENAFTNGMSLMLQVERSPYKQHSKELLLAHSHFIREEIMQRINEYGWPLQNKIMCLKIKAGRITLEEAYAAVLTQVFIMAERIGCTDEISAVLE